MNMHQLKVVTLDELFPHEGVDPVRVGRLVDEFQRDQSLNEPVIGTSIDRRIILLDGATRLAAFQRIGIRDIIVQIVDYASVALETWVHIIDRPSPAAIIKSISNLPGIRLRQIQAQEIPSALKSANSVLAFVPHGDGPLLVEMDRSGSERLDAMNQIVNLYRGLGIVRRTTLNKRMELRGDGEGMMLFPGFNRGDIVRAALNGQYLPMGVSRHIVRNRISNMNVPLSFLAAEEPVVIKQMRLKEFIHSHSPKPSEARFTHHRAKGELNPRA